MKSLAYNMKKANKKYIWRLQNTYAFCKALYSLSFKDRIEYNLGVLKITAVPSKEDKSLSVKDLEQRISDIKKPWWNFFISF